MNLSARSYVWAGAAVVIGVAGQWHPALWSGSWLIVALPWLALLGWEFTATRRPGLQAARTCPAPLRLGRRASGELLLDNTTERALDVEWAAPEPADFAALAATSITRIEPRGRQRLAFAIEPRALGESEWPALRTRVLGPAGLAWWRHDPHAPLTTRVAPDARAGRAVRAGAGRSGQRESRESGAGVEFAGLREYRPGDPLRNIDWKATARRGEPIVKQFGEDQQLELVIAVDTGRRSRVAAGTLTRFGHYINVAAQLAERSIGNGDRAATLLFADRILGELPPGHGSGHLQRLHRMLGAAHCAARESNPLVAALAVRRLLGHRGLVVFLTDMDDSEVTGQLAQATRLLAPRHLPLIGTLADPDQRAMSREPPTHWLAPYHRLAALELERARRLTTNRLRHLGAQVVSAEPERLGDDLLAAYDRLRGRRSV